MDQKAQKYVQLFHIPLDQWMELAEVHLEGKADIWYQSFKGGRNVINWEEFVEELSRSFGEVNQVDAIAELNKLQRTSTVFPTKRNLKNSYQKLS